MMSFARYSAVIVANVCLAIGVYAADDMDEKIEFLLSEIGRSDCVFIRNGKEHSAVDAEKHLRRKYRRGRKWVTDVGSFIDKFATKSSITGQRYLIRCGAKPEMQTAEWLSAKSREFAVNTEN